MSHRLPPKPRFYDIALPGQCRYCGGDVLNRKGERNPRSRWHPACVEEYRLIYWPTTTRRAVWNRDKGVCAGCGVVCQRRGGHWHVDHRKPLIEARGDLSYWRLDNLQTLCVSCHQAKTAAEAAERAARRRAAKAITAKAPRNRRS